MPRRNRARRAESAVPLRSAGLVRRRTRQDGEWLVRTVPGAEARKTYRCPGCDHEIRPGTAHIVAWPADESGSVNDRRHWHQHCFG